MLRQIICWEELERPPSRTVLSPKCHDLDMWACGKDKNLSSVSRSFWKVKTKEYNAHRNFKNYVSFSNSFEAPMAELSITYDRIYLCSSELFTEWGM